MSEEIITRNPVITLSRVLGMIFIVTCHIIKYGSSRIFVGWVTDGRD